MEDPGRGLELNAGDALPQGPGIGIESGPSGESASNSGGAQVGAGGDAMDGLTSDGSGFFNDSNDSRVFAGMDNSLGMAGSPQTETLADAEMYATQLEPSFENVPETATPLIQP